MDNPVKLAILDTQNTRHLLEFLEGKELSQPFVKIPSSILKLLSIKLGCFRCLQYSNSY